MEIEFSRDEHGYARVDVSDAYKPLDDYLEQDIQSSVQHGNEVMQAIEKVKAGELPQWIQTGNALTVILEPDKAILEHEYVSDMTCELTLDELHSAIKQWLDFQA